MKHHPDYFFPYFSALKHKANGSININVSDQADKLKNYRLTESPPAPKRIKCSNIIIYKLK